MYNQAKVGTLKHSACLLRVEKGKGNLQQATT
jgi:hypothetical protein